MKSSAILDRIRTLVDATPPFNQLSDEDRQDILGDLSIEYFKPGDVIIEQGSRLHQGLYLVESGVVRLMEVTQQRLIDKCGEGDVFGSLGLIKGGAYIYEAKAVEPTVCAVLKAARFQELYDQNKDFAAYFDTDFKRFIQREGATMDVSGAYLLFSQRLAQLPLRPPIMIAPDQTVQEAAQLMNKQGIGSLLVMRRGKIDGMLTDSDLRARFVARGLAADTPVRRVMSSPVVTIAAGASLFEALTCMLEQRVRRLVVTEGGLDQVVPIGLLTHSDLVHFRGLDPVATVTRLEGIASVGELINVRREVNEHLLRLYQQGISPEMLGRLLALLYDRIVVRVLELVEEELKSTAGKQRVDLPWVWMRLGSSGRQEMALNSAQHNAVLYANPSSEAEGVQAEQWFNLLAERVNEALEACGFTSSAVVARDARWRKSLRSWKQTYRTWIFQADNQDLLTAPIFFDLRGSYGELSLVGKLEQDLEDALNVQEMDPQRKFLQRMASLALERRPPLSFFRRLTLERSGELRQKFDMRERGMLPVVDIARVLALETRFFSSMNTFDRLRHAAEVVPELAEQLTKALEAYHVLADFRLEHQLRLIELGEPPDDYMNPISLTKIQQSLLRKAFGDVASLQKTISEYYNTSRSG